MRSDLYRRREFLRWFAGSFGLAMVPRIAGGTAEQTGSSFPFSEVTSSAIRFLHTSGKSPQKYLPESTGAGRAFFDYDNDGWMDIYLVSSGWRAVDI